jgi:hypothetical protein
MGGDEHALHAQIIRKVVGLNIDRNKIRILGIVGQ